MTDVAERPANEPPAEHEDDPSRPDPETGRPRQRIGVGKRLWRGIREDDVAGLAAEIAYRFLFAVFPFGLFVAALSAFIASVLGIDDPAGKVISGVGDNLPPQIAASLVPELDRLFSTTRPALLSFGAIAALWAATGGINALTKGIHRAYDVRERRPFLWRYVVAVLLTLGASLVVILSFVTIMGGAMLTDQIDASLGLGDTGSSVVGVLRWPIVFVLLTGAVALLYRYGPRLVVPWRWILVGAGVFTVGWLVATIGLGFYAANVADYGATYGSLGGVIVLMLWFYLTAALLVIGAEVTAALAQERSPLEIHERGEDARIERAAGQQPGRDEGSPRPERPAGHDLTGASRRVEPS